MVIIKSLKTSKSSLNSIRLQNRLQDLLKSDYTISKNLYFSNKRTICQLLLEKCEDCTKMAALPQGAFAACKLRELKDKDLMVARMRSGNDRNDTKNINTNEKLTEYTPAKYNGKLMNSIWGFYNRYSPHNIKGNDYKSSEKDYIMQQHFAVASSTIAEDLAMGIRSGKE